MTAHKHLWETVELDAGGYHRCKKCKLGSEGDDALATPCPVSDAEHHATAWLGLFMLYLTREEAGLNGEPQPTPVSLLQLLEHAQRYLLITRHLGLRFKQPDAQVTKTPEETDTAIDAYCARLRKQNNVQTN